MTVTEAARLTSLSRMSLRRGLRRASIEIYMDPLDGRKRLIRVSDIDRLRTPVPLRDAGRGAGGSTVMAGSSAGT